MKKILLLFSIMLLSGVYALAGTATSDCFTLSSATLTPGGKEVKVTLSLNGSRLYTAYNMDITLPEGVELNYYNDAPDVSMAKNGGIYPYEEDRDENKTYYHTLSCSYGVIGPKVLRIACISTQNKNFTANSGALINIYLKASAFAKPGTADISFTGQAITAIEEGNVVQYDPSDRIDQNVTIGTSSTVALNISAANQYSTCILPFDADLPSGVTAYSCDDYKDGFAMLKSASSFAAYTPYIVFSETGYSNNISGTVDASKYVASATNDYLNGAIVPQQITEGYILQNQGEGAKFYNANGESFTIPSGKCWLTLPSSAKDEVGFAFDTPSAIEAIPESAEGKETTIYDLTGRSILNPQVGQVYIMDGKKVIKIK